MTELTVGSQVPSDAPQKSPSQIEGWTLGVTPSEMEAAQRLSRRALQEVASLAVPGMRESDIVAIAGSVLKRMGSPRAWHRSVVRIGVNTVHGFSENRTAEAILQESDIFFLDLGPNWMIGELEIEGDVGETFVRGSRIEFLKLAQAAQALFNNGCAHWRKQQVTGSVLYDWLENRAKAMGYTLRVDVDGHRVSEFSHQSYFRHGLCEIDFVPQTGRWILEIQLRDESTGYGAFFEDLLL